MGGGIGMGNTCKPMAVSFQCMTKFTTNKKKKNLPKKKKKKRLSAVIDLKSCSLMVNCKRELCSLGSARAGCSLTTAS